MRRVDDEQFGYTTCLSFSRITVRQSPNLFRPSTRYLRLGKRIDVVLLSDDVMGCRVRGIRRRITARPLTGSWSRYAVDLKIFTRRPGSNAALPPVLLATKGQLVALPTENWHDLLSKRRRLLERKIRCNSETFNHRFAMIVVPSPSTLRWVIGIGDTSQHRQSS